MGDRWGTDDENSWVRQVEVQVGGGGDNEDRWVGRGVDGQVRGTSDGDRGTGGEVADQVRATLPSPSHLHPTPTAQTHTSLGL